MVQHEDYREQNKEFRAILNKAILFEHDEEIKNYLDGEFAGFKDLFCQFIGFCSSTLRDPLIKIKRHKIVILMTAIAMEGISLGWDEGYNSAKRIFFPSLNVGVSA